MLLEEGQQHAPSKPPKVLYFSSMDCLAEPSQHSTPLLPEYSTPLFPEFQEAETSEEQIKAFTECSLATSSEFQYAAQNVDVPIVIVTSELDPWSKSGGLAIVTAAYAYNFAIRGHRTMAIVPKYDDHYEDINYQESKSFELFGTWHEVRYFHQYQSYGHGKGCDYVFIDHPVFHRPGGLYHNVASNQEYSDNLFRFALFSIAALEVPVALELGGAPKYGSKVTFVATDWQAGLLPVYLQHRHRANGKYHEARCLFVVCNLGYQGSYPLRLGLPPVQYDNFQQLGLPFAALEDLHYKYPDHSETLNLMKGGLICCDRILTLSPCYADEIQTPEGGCCLQNIVASKSCFLGGILNGIDKSWNPCVDSSIVSCFSAADMTGKKACKRALQQNLGLDVDPGACIMSFVGRLTPQKGIDLLGAVIDWLMEDWKDGLNRVQLIIMGNGELCYGNMLRWAEHRWKGRICGYYGFDPQVERELQAGSDYLLMPSRYEPCGIPQMCAMAYGTIPIVHATGGLRDSVRSFYNDESTSTGFHVLPLSQDSLKRVMFDALVIFFRRPQILAAMRQRAMAQDFSWTNAIDEYERHIDWTLSDPPFHWPASH